ncbi:hypothetical protein JTE90_000813 [Oedothorax gibbosus]|uniref:Uncharacterized protein n=1 Tax=Oedothorax gibbosus TaxID=931172 RepID=A0AAV6TQM0_9ARAC|nr:hypothetical protein JTE90_000813 [Oedothorax gibbosus]
MAEVQKEDKELQDLLNRPEGTSLKLQPMQFQNSNLYCDTSTCVLLTFVPASSEKIVFKPVSPDISSWNTSDAEITRSTIRLALHEDGRCKPVQDHAPNASAIKFPGIQHHLSDRSSCPQKDSSTSM